MTGNTATGTTGGAAATKDWGLPFEPRPAEGRGRGRKYPYTQEEFEALYARARELGGAERKALLAAYDIGFAALKGRVEPDAAASHRKRAPGKRKASDSTAQTAPGFGASRGRDAMLETLRTRRDALREELERIEKQIGFLEGTDDETLGLIADLVR